MIFYSSYENLRNNICKNYVLKIIYRKFMLKMKFYRRYLQEKRSICSNISAAISANDIRSTKKREYLLISEGYSGSYNILFLEKYSFFKIF